MQFGNYEELAEKFFHFDMNDRSIIDTLIAELQQKYGDTVTLVFESEDGDYEWRVLPISTLNNPVVKRVMMVRSGAEIKVMAIDSDLYGDKKEYLVGKFPLIGMKYADILDRLTADRFSRICSDIEDYIAIGCMDQCAREITGRLAQEKDEAFEDLKAHLDTATPTDVVVGGEDPKYYDDEEKEEGEVAEEKPKATSKDIMAFIKGCINHGTELCDPLPKQDTEKIEKLKGLLSDKMLPVLLRRCVVSIGLLNPSTMSIIQWMKEKRMELSANTDELVAILKALYNEEIREVDMLLRNKADITGKIDHRSLYVLPYSIIPSFLLKFGRTMDRFKDLLNDYIGGYLKELDLSKCYITGSAIACCLFEKKKGEATIGPIDHCRQHANMLRHYPYFYSPLAWYNNKVVEVETDGKTFNVKSVPPVSGTLREGSDVDICVEVETEEEFKDEVDKIFKVVSEARPGVILVEREKKTGKVYSIVDPDPVGAFTFRKVEIYRASFAHILTHHVSMVRGAYTSKMSGKPELWLAASCLLTAHDMENHHYWVFASKKTTPVEVMGKYTARGFRFRGAGSLAKMLPEGEWGGVQDDAVSYLYNTPREYYVNGYLCPLLVNFNCPSCRLNVKSNEALKPDVVNFNLYKQPIQLSKLSKKALTDEMGEIKKMMNRLEKTTDKAKRGRLLGKIHERLLKFYVRDGGQNMSGTVAEGKLYSAIYSGPGRKTIRRGGVTNAQAPAPPAASQMPNYVPQQIPLPPPGAQLDDRTAAALQEVQDRISDVATISVKGANVWVPLGVSPFQSDDDVEEDEEKGETPASGKEGKEEETDEEEEEKEEGAFLG